MVYFEDECYKKYIGKFVYIFGINIKILVIEDDYVDKVFGIGVVKVILVYDFNDYEVVKRYNLEMFLCMNEDGIMNEFVFKYVG